MKYSAKKLVVLVLSFSALMAGCSSGSEWDDQDNGLGDGFGPLGGGNPRPKSGSYTVQDSALQGGRSTMGSLSYKALGQIGDVNGENRSVSYKSTPIKPPQ
ncbi:MAG: hypothetical protein HYS22_01715 [Deltaproteobacteria bacterium]|nr:hypothetical protein [Deltaproteobacteria bacterium]